MNVLRSEDIEPIAQQPTSVTSTCIVGYITPAGLVLSEELTPELAARFPGDVTIEVNDDYVSVADNPYQELFALPLILIIYDDHSEIEYDDGSLDVLKDIRHHIGMGRRVYRLINSIGEFQLLSNISAYADDIYVVIGWAAREPRAVVWKRAKLAEKVEAVWGAEHHMDRGVFPFGDVRCYSDDHPDPLGAMRGLIEYKKILSALTTAEKNGWASGT